MAIGAVTILLAREMTTRRQKRFEARTNSVWAIKPTRGLARRLAKKTMESEILKEALEIAGGPKKHLLRSLPPPRGGFWNEIPLRKSKAKRV